MNQAFVALYNSSSDNVLLYPVKFPSPSADKNPNKTNNAKSAQTIPKDNFLLLFIFLPPDFLPVHKP